MAGTNSGGTHIAHSPKHLGYQARDKETAHWMIQNVYLEVNSEDTIFKKTKGFYYIIHGLSVDNMMQEKMNSNKRLSKYLRVIEITGGGLIKTFLGMEVEQM